MGDGWSSWHVHMFRRHLLDVIEQMPFMFNMRLLSTWMLREDEYTRIAAEARAVGAGFHVERATNHGLRRWNRTKYDIEPQSLPETATSTTSTLPLKFFNPPLWTLILIEILR